MKLLFDPQYGKKVIIEAEQLTKSEQKDDWYN